MEPFVVFITLNDCFVPGPVIGASGSSHRKESQSISPGYSKGGLIFLQDDPLLTEEMNETVFFLSRESPSSPCFGGRASFPTTIPALRNITNAQALCQVFPKYPSLSTSLSCTCRLWALRLTRFSDVLVCGHPRNIGFAAHWYRVFGAGRFRRITTQRQVATNIRHLQQFRYTPPS